MIQRRCDICGRIIPDTKHWEHDRVANEFLASEVRLFEGIFTRQLDLCDVHTYFLKQVLEDFKEAMKASCFPYPGSARLIEQSDGKILVEWDCDTAGNHERTFISKSEAERFIQDLEQTAKLGPMYQWYKGETTSEVHS